jgi:SAM-dependent methyltransferase
MSSGAIIDSINRRTMSEVVADYGYRDDLHESEEAALGSVRAEAKGRRILDLGVGAGRTVKALREISTDYIGVDYVPEMVAYCRQRYPGVRFEQADARAMPQFADASFDLVVFSCNGICMVDHPGRLGILREVRRLLAPGGTFVFSTSNRNHPKAGRYLWPDFKLTANPVRLAVRTARFVGEAAYRAFNRVRLKPAEIRTEDYAILNDRSHHFRTMNYFITLDQQVRQLREIGFPLVPEVFDELGQRIEDDTTHGTMTFVVRTTPAPHA